MDTKLLTKRAIKAAGGTATVAADLGLSVSAVAHWPCIPARHLARLVEMSGFEGRQLRPDLWPAFAPRQGDDKLPAEAA